MYPKGYLSPVLRHPKEKHTHTQIFTIYIYIHYIYIYIHYIYNIYIYNIYIYIYKIYIYIIYIYIIYIYNIYNIYIIYIYIIYIYIPYIRIGVPFLRHRRLLGALGMALSRQRSRVKCYAPTMRTTSSLMQVFG